MIDHVVVLLGASLILVNRQVLHWCIDPVLVNEKVIRWCVGLVLVI